MKDKEKLEEDQIRLASLSPKDSLLYHLLSVYHTTFIFLGSMSVLGHCKLASVKQGSSILGASLLQEVSANKMLSGKVNLLGEAEGKLRCRALREKEMILLWMDSRTQPGNNSAVEPHLADTYSEQKISLHGCSRS